NKRYPDLIDYVGPVEANPIVIHVWDSHHAKDAIQWAQDQPKYMALHASRQQDIVKRYQTVLDLARTYVGFFNKAKYDETSQKFREFCANHKIVIVDSFPLAGWSKTPLESFRDFDGKIILRNWTEHSSNDDDLDFI
ncbi:MAG TPA: hypothetical protein PLS50_09345, partial [Candidatus Dojkabacteria bacterium]|nr:hypothetical protein [Candidatus Dojkabacteria bacterium]